MLERATCTTSSFRHFSLIKTNLGHPTSSVLHAKITSTNVKETSWNACHLQCQWLGIFKNPILMIAIFVWLTLLVTTIKPNIWLNIQLLTLQSGQLAGMLNLLWCLPELNLQILTNFLKQALKWQRNKERMTKIWHQIFQTISTNMCDSFLSNPSTTW